MANRLPLYVAGAVGVVSGLWIFNQPLQEVTGHTPTPQPVKDGRSQGAKDGKMDDGSPSSPSPRPSLRYGGSTPSQHEGSPTVAGTSPEGKKGYSADHDIKTRSNPKEQDGTSGGGVGVAEMRERKMEGRGLPSPQGGDTPPKPVDGTMHQGEQGGVKQPKNGRWWLGGW